MGTQGCFGGSFQVKQCLEVLVHSRKISVMEKYVGN